MNNSLKLLWEHFFRFLSLICQHFDSFLQSPPLFPKMSADVRSRSWSPTPETGVVGTILERLEVFNRLLILAGLAGKTLCGQEVSPYRWRCGWQESFAPANLEKTCVRHAMSRASCRLAATEAAVLTAHWFSLPFDLLLLSLMSRFGTLPVQRL